MIMKRLLLIISFMMALSSSNAVKYRELGFDAKFSVYVFDGVKYLLLSFEDSKNKQISGYTIIKFKLKNNQVIRLENTQAGERAKTKSVSWISGIVSSSASNIHYVFFEITPEIMDMLQVGIKAITINTIPEVYYYAGDETEKFGELIYKDLKNLKDEFEE